MTTTHPVRARFEVEFGVRTGVKRDDYKVMQPGETIELTETLKILNTSSGVCLFDLSPEVQQREFGKIICRTGDFPETEDPAARRWYRPIADDPGYAEIHGSIPKTSNQTIYYGPGQ